MVWNVLSTVKAATLVCPRPLKMVYKSVTSQGTHSEPRPSCQSASQSVSTEVRPRGAPFSCPSFFSLVLLPFRLAEKVNRGQMTSSIERRRELNIVDPSLFLKCHLAMSVKLKFYLCVYLCIYLQVCVHLCVHARVHACTPVIACV